MSFAQRFCGLSISRLGLVLGLALFTSAAHACADASKSLAEACPDLLIRAEQQGLLDSLAVSPQEPADAARVMQLEQYLLDLSSQSEQIVGADQTQLEQVIAANYERALVKEESMFERLARWWNSLFKNDSNESGSDLSGFFNRLEPSETFARLLFFLLLGLMLAFAVVHGWREVQPLFAAYRVQRKQRAIALARAQEWPPNLAGLSGRASLARVYARLVAVLGQRGVVPDTSALTHAEAASAIEADALISDGQRSAFQALAQRASDSLFAEQEPDQVTLQSALSSAEQLLAASQATAAARRKRAREFAAKSTSAGPPYA